MLQKQPSHFNKFNQDCLFITTDQNYLPFLVTEEFVVAEHNSFCTSQNCKYHILLYSESPYMEKLTNLLFSFLKVDTLYFTFKFYFAENIIISKGVMVQTISDAVRYNKVHKYMEHRPSIIKKRLLRKTAKTHSPVLKRKNISIQTPRNTFMERIATVMESPAAIDLVRIVDCLIDTYGFINNDRINFYYK